MLTTKLDKAMQLGDYRKALIYLEQLLRSDSKNEKLLCLKVKLGIKLNTNEPTMAALETLILIAPQNLQYSITLANLHLNSGRTQAAPKVFEPLLSKFQHPDLYFNYAWFLSKAADYKNALIFYRKSIELGISGAEEVHLNIANIYSSSLFSPNLAREHLMLALQLKPNYVSAIYNLGNLEEDSGNRSAAIAQFKKIRAINPLHGKASARLAMAMDADESTTMMQELEALSSNQLVNVDSRIDCLYALGKLSDQRKDYKKAFSHWELANRLNQEQLGQFSRVAFSKTIDGLIKNFSAAWFDNLEQTGTAAPVFIGGMFRSGSTLLEQILASHSGVTPAGELDFFPRTSKELGANYLPSKGYDPSEINSLATQYLKKLNSIDSSDSIVTDKRPDNLLHLGLIKTVFPRSRFIVTERQIKDNCLSIFAHRFGRDMRYACDIEDTYFYSRELNRLVDHWKSLFSDTIHVVQYDELVIDPKTVVSSTLNFLDLEWEDSCLNFHQLHNVVSTASVWQIRQPLYQRSSGRWRHYKSQLSSVID
jgi:tetratricopeptide (TPR) repeat protein